MLLKILFWRQSAINIFDEKLFNPSKKRMENSIWAKCEDYNPWRASQKTLRKFFSLEFEAVICFEADLYIKRRVVDSLHNPDLNTMWYPVKIKDVTFKELSCWRQENVSLYSWACYFCWWGCFASCKTQIHKAQQGRGEAKCQRKQLCLNFFLTS